jgi:hypothetical protein
VEAGQEAPAAGVGTTNVVVADVETCDFMASTPDLEEFRRSGIRAVQSTPLRSRSAGRSACSTHWRTPHEPTEDDFRLFDVLARQAMDLIERTLAEEALRQSETLPPHCAHCSGHDLDVGGQGQISYLNQTWIDYRTAIGGDGRTATGRRPPPGRSGRCVEVCREGLRAASLSRWSIGSAAMTRLWLDRDGGVPRYDVDRSFAGYIGTGVDITERKLAERLFPG